MASRCLLRRGSWGGGIWQDIDALLSASANLRGKDFVFLLINGDQDRPDAFAALAAKLSGFSIPHKVTVLKDTSHNLGLYGQAWWRRDDAVSQRAPGNYHS